MSRRAKYISLGVLIAALIALVLSIAGVFGGVSPTPGETTVTTGGPGETTLPGPTTSAAPSTTAVGDDATTSTQNPPTSSVPDTVPDTEPDTVPPTLPPDDTTTTLPPADDPGAGEDLQQPVPLGQAVELGQWRIGVSAVQLDATETVLGFVDFNAAPAAGAQFLMVELSGVYLGNSIVQPVLDWALVKEGFTHVPDGLECGVIPNSIYDVDQVAPGQQFTANVCFEIATVDVTEDLVLTLGLLDATGRERFFSLR